MSFCALICDYFSSGAAGAAVAASDTAGVGCTDRVFVLIRLITPQAMGAPTDISSF